MKCKVSATQEAIHINEVGEPPSSAPQSNSPVQTILQRSHQGIWLSSGLVHDRHGIFTKHDPEDFAPTQFQRATNALSIATLQASTPQAKGRVERLFHTLQDRMVKAMRLASIDNMAQANEHLPELIA